MMILYDLTNFLLGYRRVTLTDTDRAIVTRKGRILEILGAGEHRVRTADVVQTFSLLDPKMPEGIALAMKRGRPDLAALALTEVTAAAGEVVVVHRDGRPFAVVGPEAVAFYLAEAGAWTVERYPVAEAEPVERALAERLTRAGLGAALVGVVVPEAHVAVVFADGRLVQTLGAGVHRFWAAGPAVGTKVVDLRLRSKDVTGQEILTRDRVALRVNLAAD
jgi:hypothetical protein